VLLEGDRAVGVETVQAGRHVQEYGDEIVLSAGAVHSPGILMRSGIGPARLLSDLSIDVVADLPVGESMQDHPMICVVLPLRPENTVKSLDDRAMNSCCRFSSGDPDGLPNDLMLLGANWSDPTGATWPFIPVGGDESDLTRAGMMGILLNSTYSRGTVRIASRDPLVQPVVEEGMLADERDLRRLRYGARLLADLVERDTVYEICTSRPSEANSRLWRALDNDAALDQYLLNTIVDTMHATSTCRMGPAGSPTSVVDPDLRVLGVQGLRVADASIFPSVPRSNTNLATICVGEATGDRLG
jgi:choline dehydrogenase